MINNFLRLELDMQSQSASKMGARLELLQDARQTRAHCGVREGARIQPPCARMRHAAPPGSALREFRRRI